MIRSTPEQNGAVPQEMKFQKEKNQLLRLVSHDSDYILQHLTQVHDGHYKCPTQGPYSKAKRIVTGTNKGKCIQFRNEITQRSCRCKNQNVAEEVEIVTVHKHVKNEIRRVGRKETPAGKVKCGRQNETL